MEICLSVHRDILLVEYQHILDVNLSTNAGDKDGDFDEEDVWRGRD